MNETGDKLDAAYRALRREEPGAALDAAILAASRRAVAKPTAARRWAAPVSIAAVLVLAFGVTLRMQLEKPGVESPDVYSSPPAAAAVPAAPERAQGAAEPAPSKNEADTGSQRGARAKAEKKIIVPAAKPDVAPVPQPKLQAAPAQPQALEENVRQRRDESRVEDSKEMLQKQKDRDVQAFPAAPAAPAAPPASTAAPAAEGRMKREAFAAPRAPAAAGIAADAQAPMDEATRELEAIAKLRVEGRQEEADKALAEFRRKRPDYRIPEAMWERVKPR
jgi:hypothetical protein